VIRNCFEKCFILYSLIFIVTAVRKAAVFEIKIYTELIKISSFYMFIICKYSSFKYYINFRIWGAGVENIFGSCSAELMKLQGFLDTIQV
jgi:hypothetical protein